MQQRTPSAITRSKESILASNAVLRNTYLLLSLTLLFSAATSGLAMAFNTPPLNPFITLIGYFGLLFATQRVRNSGWGIVLVFALTGFMGYTLGPILNMYIRQFANGSELVMMALGSTGLTFLVLSGYALTTRKDFSFLRSFLFVGLIIGFIASIATLFLHVPMLNVVVSGLFVIISSGMILFQTSEIIHGGETNYIMATITLYVSLYNLFLSLLNLFAMFSGNRD
jgi:modulator of FtsH protease